MPETLTSTINLSGMLYAKTDENTRLLDAIYARGRAGGSRTLIVFCPINREVYSSPLSTWMSRSRQIKIPAPSSTSGISR